MTWTDENENWPRSEWQQDIANGDTQLGYWEWVEHNKEAEAEMDKLIRLGKIESDLA